MGHRSWAQVTTTGHDNNMDGVLADVRRDRGPSMRAVLSDDEHDCHIVLALQLVMVVVHALLGTPVVVLLWTVVTVRRWWWWWCV